MTVGLHYATVLPLAGMLAAAAGLAGAAAGARWWPRAARLGLALVAAGWPLYMAAFVALDYRLAEVAGNAAGDLSVILRFGASWAGGGGSLYLYATLLAVAGLYLTRRPERQMLAAAMAGMVLVVMVTAALSGAFSVNPPGVGGFGVNPLLKSPWLLIHPPTTFAGYSLLLAGSLALLFGEHQRGRAVFLAGWGFLSLGLVLGGMWSYETLGWGGYWGWDPVEVAQLSVWLAAAAAVHSLGPLAPLRPSMLYLTASTALLAPYITRSGLSPLHSFAPESLAGLLLLAGALAFLALSIASASKTSLSGLSRALAGGRVEEASIALAGASIIVIAFFVYASLLVPGVLVVLGVEASPPSMDAGIAFYHPVLYPLFTFALLWLPGYFLGSRIGWRGLRLIQATTLAVAAVAAAAAYTGLMDLLPEAPNGTDARVAAGLAIAGAALASTAASAVLEAARRAPPWVRLRGVLVRAAHAGIALTFIGVLVSGYYAYSVSIFGEAVLRPGEPVEVAGFTLELIGYEYEVHPGDVDLYSHLAGQALPAFLAWTALSDSSRSLSKVLGEAYDVARKGPEGQEAKALLEAARLLPSNASASASPGPATLEAPDAAGAEVYVSIEAVGAAYLLASGGIVTAAMDGMVSLELEGLNATLQAGRIALNLTSPLTIQAGEVTVTAWRVAIELPGNVTLSDGSVEAEASLIVGDGLLETPGGRAELPAAPDEGTYYLILSETTAPAIRELLALPQRPPLADPSLAAEAAGPAPPYTALPREALPGVSLKFYIKVTSGDESWVETVTMRFEANGEASGIRGLVMPALVLRAGLGDLYIIPQPPMTRGYYGEYHELIVYYLSQALKELPPREALALTALMAAGYTASEAASSPRPEAPVQRAMIDLYLLAVNFDPASSVVNQGLVVSYKAVPWVDLVWAGALAFTAATLALAVLQAAAGHGSRKA